MNQVIQAASFIGQAVVTRTASNIFTGVGAASSMTSGILAQRSYNTEAELQDEQGSLLNEEAIAEAAKIDADSKSEIAAVTMSYVKGGVLVSSGSPLLAINEKMVEDKKLSDSKRAQGYSQKRLASKKASIARNKGRSAIVGGTGQAIRTLTDFI
jgi:hypothetical protein